MELKELERFLDQKVESINKLTAQINSYSVGRIPELKTFAHNCLHCGRSSAAEFCSSDCHENYLT